MDHRCTRLICDIAYEATDADMLVFIDQLAASHLSLDGKVSRVDRMRLAEQLRKTTLEGALRAQRRMVARAYLSQRECHVADLLEVGMTNLAMARKMGIGERTVRSHLEAMNQKLLTSNRTELLSRLLGG